MSEFSKNRTTKDGLQHWCKYCKSAKDKIYQKDTNYNKQYYSTNKEKISLQQKEYYKDNRELIIEKRKEIPLETKRRWERTENKKKYKKSYKQRPEVKIRLAKRHRERYRDDIQYKLTISLRNRIGQIFNLKKSKTTKELLGCEISAFKEYLESLFLPTMTLDNYGTVWHIDHIKPCAAFDLTDPEQQKICFHYTHAAIIFHNQDY